MALEVRKYRQVWAHTRALTPFKVCWQVVNDVDGTILQDDLPSKAAADAAKTLLQGG